MGAAQSGCFDHRDHAHISYTNRRPSLYRSLAHHPEALVQHRLAFNAHILLLTGHPSTCTANQLMCSAGLVSAITWSLQLRELTRSRCSTYGSAHSQRPPGSYAERPWDELPECSGSIH